jgi:hypothetical protein
MEGGKWTSNNRGNHWHQTLQEYIRTTQTQTVSAFSLRYNFKIKYVNTNLKSFLEKLLLQ